MNEHRSSQDRTRSCLVEITATVLAVLAMLAISTSYRNFDDAFACGGGLGVGFPISFLCDYATGGSPINSWGRLDLSDFPYFSLTGLFVDSLFYAAILVIGWLARLVFRQNDRFPAGNLLWGAVAANAFLMGFLAASAMFKADRVNFHDYILGIPSPYLPPPPLLAPCHPDRRSSPDWDPEISMILLQREVSVAPHYRISGLLNSHLDFLDISDHWLSKNELGTQRNYET